jgi:Zn-finger protein
MISRQEVAARLRSAIATGAGLAMEPKDSTNDQGFKGFTNESCPFLPCHPGVRREFNCLFCYCPLIAYECPGPYEVFTDANGVTRKDCSACTLPHDGYQASWAFIQRWLAKPVVWDGHSQHERYMRKARLKQALPSASTKDAEDE